MKSPLDKERRTEKVRIITLFREDIKTFVLEKNNNNK